MAPQNAASQARDVIVLLKRRGTKKVRDSMARYGLPSNRAFGVSVDRTPHAWRKVAAWSRRRDEFGKRAAFALLACLALHDKTAPDAPFLKSLPLIERAATDDRNFVKKGVSWALRLIGRRNLALHAAAVEVATRLAASSAASAKWIGKDAVRELKSPAVVRRLKTRSRAESQSSRTA